MWEIVIALVAFTISIFTLAKPIVNLNSNISSLNTTVKQLTKAFTENEDANKTAHKEFYKRLDNNERDVVELKTKIDIYHK